MAIVWQTKQDVAHVLIEATIDLRQKRVIPRSERHRVILYTRLIEVVDDGPGKARGIDLFIGQRPQIAFGNSDGDREMLEWTTAGDGKRLGLLVLHDDAAREFAYGPANGLPDSRIGTFSQALMDEAKDRGWAVISMKDDWKTIFRP